MDEPEVAADGPSAHAGPDPQPGPEVIAQEASSGTGDKKVSWAELFFDLVFVVAVTRVSALVEYESNAIGLVQALVTFVPIYWLWVGVAVLTNQSDVSEPKVRLKIFLVALAGVFLALSLPEAFGRLGLLFALSYWFGRIVLGWRMLLTLFIRPVRLPLNPYTVSMVITGPLLVIGALSPVGEDHGVPRMVVWGVAALIDLSTPTVLAARLSGMHYDAGHLSERFGLFVLIALGESVVAVASARSEDLDLIGGLGVAAAFAVSIGLWWVCISTLLRTPFGTPWPPPRSRRTSPARCCPMGISCS